MKVIVRGRQEGKTYDLVQWVKQGVETNSYPGWSRVILTHSIQEAERIRDLYDLNYRQVFSAEEWRTARLGRTPVEIAVDNAEIILASHLRQYISQIAMTGSTE